MTQRHLPGIADDDVETEQQDRVDHDGLDEVDVIRVPRQQRKHRQRDQRDPGCDNVFSSSRRRPSNLFDRGFAEQAPRVSPRARSATARVPARPCSRSRCRSPVVVSAMPRMTPPTRIPHAARQPADNRDRKRLEPEHGAHRCAVSVSGAISTPAKAAVNDDSAYEKRDHEASVDAHQRGGVAVVGGSDDGLAEDRLAVEELDREHHHERAADHQQFHRQHVRTEHFPAALRAAATESANRRGPIRSRRHS